MAEIFEPPQRDKGRRENRTNRQPSSVFSVALWQSLIALSTRLSEQKCLKRRMDIAVMPFFCQVSSDSSDKPFLDKSHEKNSAVCLFLPERRCGFCL